MTSSRELCSRMTRSDLFPNSQIRTFSDSDVAVPGSGRLSCTVDLTGLLTVLAVVKSAVERLYVNNE